MGSGPTAWPALPPHQLTANPPTSVRQPPRPGVEDGAGQGETRAEIAQVREDSGVPLFPLSVAEELPPEEETQTRPAENRTLPPSSTPSPMPFSLPGQVALTFHLGTYHCHLRRMLPPPERPDQVLLFYTLKSSCLEPSRAVSLNLPGPLSG